MSLDVNISEPDEFNCIELHDSIKEVAKIKKISDFSYHVDLVCGNGGNYVANVFRVLIKENETNKKVNIIIKTLINITRKGLFSEIHYREVRAYSQIIAKFIEIQSMLEEKNKIVLPECILSNTDRGNEVIILEDLMTLGFEMFDKLFAHENLDYSQVELVVIYLAKFQSLSFVYESKEDKSRFDEIRKEFCDILYQKSFLSKSRLKNYFVESFDMSLNLIEDSTTRKKLELVKEKLLDLLRMYTAPRKYNVFCHGDCWMNNILFKKDKNYTVVNEYLDPEIKKNYPRACLVDFQTMRYANPITDILHFLYISTDSKFRSEHLEELKACYYKNFQAFLTLFSLDANSLYPEEEFRKDFEDLLPYGLIISLIELRIATTNPDDEVVLKKLAKSKHYSEEEAGALRLYQLRVNDVCIEYEQSGLLDKLLYLVNNLN